MKVNMRGGSFEMSVEFIPILMKELAVKQVEDYIFNPIDNCYVFIKDIIEFENEKGLFISNNKYSNKNR